MIHIELNENWLIASSKREVDGKLQYGFTVFKPEDDVERKSGDFAPEWVDKSPDDKEGVTIWAGSLETLRILQDYMNLVVLQSQNYHLQD